MRPLVFSRRSVLALWWLIFVFNAINATFLLMLSLTYLNFKDATGVLNFLTVIFLYSSSTKYLEANYRIIGAGYAILAVPYVYGLYRMVVSLLRTRKFAFQSMSSANRGATSCGICCCRSLLTLQGKHFTIFLTVVETVEVALQTWQAYRTSKYIGSTRVNQLYGILIFINCWSTTIIHYIWEHKRHHSLMARFISVLTDVVLDFVWGVVLQGVLFWRYWSVYVDQSKIGDMLQVPETPDRELRQILVVSVSNFLFSGLPFVTTAIVVHRICAMLQFSQTRKRAVVPTELGPTMSNVEKREVNRSPTTENRLYLTKVSLMRRIWAPYAMIMVLWGTAILIVSIVSSGVFWPTEITHTQCVDRLHPWLTRRESCVGRAINCTALGIHGNRTEIASVLDTINPYLLGNLAFTDCPGLEIPSAIHNFSGIQTIAIRQSTLVEWNEDAAISDRTFPELQSVQLVDVHTLRKPVGITAHRFPSTFEWLRLKSTNAESYIHEVEGAWWSTHYFHCIECGLATLPSALDYIDDLVDLELEGNSLVSIPASFLSGKWQLRYLTLAGNPITDMSADVWSLTSQLFLLDIQRTNISSIPGKQLSRGSSDVAIWAFGSPICEAGDSIVLPPQVSCDEQLKST